MEKKYNFIVTFLYSRGFFSMGCCEVKWVSDKPELSYAEYEDICSYAKKQFHAKKTATSELFKICEVAKFLDPKTFNVFGSKFLSYGLIFLNITFKLNYYLLNNCTKKIIKLNTYILLQ